MECKKITYDEIIPFWKNLWGEIIIPKSGMLLNGRFDEKIKKDNNIIPTFFGIFDKNKIIGVNSGHSTYKYYRSRGLYVLPEYRKQGIAQQLLKITKEQAKKENKNIFWTYPRKEAVSVYLRFGFKQISKFQKGEFGQNCYMFMTLY